MKLTMTQLDAFSAIMEVGTTAGAAVAMHTSQPSISRALKQLEDATGLLLFERIDNRLRPTSVAFELLEFVQQSYLGLNRISRAAEELRLGSAGLLHVGCLPAFSQGYFAAVMRRTRDVEESLRVNLRPMLSREVLRAMLTREVDVGIAAYAVADDRLISEPLVSINEVIACHIDHPFAQKDEVSWQDINGQDILMLDNIDPYRRRLEQHLERRDIKCRVRAEVPTTETLCSLVLQNLGIAFVNPITAIDQLDHGMVLRRYTADFPFHVSLLTSDRLNDNSAGKKFVKALKEEIKNREALIQEALK